VTATPGGARTDGAPKGTPYTCLRCDLGTGGHGVYVPGTGRVAHRSEADCAKALAAYVPWRIRLECHAGDELGPTVPPDWLADVGIAFDDDLESIRRSRAHRRSP